MQTTPEPITPKLNDPGNPVGLLPHGDFYVVHAETPDINTPGTVENIYFSRYATSLKRRKMKGMENMNLIEILKARGIGDDIIKAVQDDMKANKIFTSSEENIDIRYGKLKADHEAVVRERDEGKTLIESLQKSNKGNEDLQKQVTDYQTKMEQLQKELQQTKIDSAINVGLLSAGVKPEDVDYVTFKLKAKGEIELDDQGNIKGWDDKVAGLKTQFPANFASAGGKKYEEHKLPDDSDGGDTLTRESLLKKPYAERMKIYNENPEAYKTAMNSK